MAPSPPRLRILSVGGNSVSAFLSWRLQATTSCDVTLVWKNGFENASTYGISFKSKQFGNERFKPRHVCRSPDEAASRQAAFDYVLLCVKALPDVYDLAKIIEPAVTKEHTCIIVNTTNTIGVETLLEERFPSNIVLSLVSLVDLKQTGACEFEHGESSDVWVGSAMKHETIPHSIQNDMAEALAMTLSTGAVECMVSDNILQQQFENNIGQIVFHPMSVLCENPNLTQLVEKNGMRTMIEETIDELITLATALGCSFPDDYRDKTIATMAVPSDNPNIMYQEFLHRQPMEVEQLLGSPLNMAKRHGIKMPRLDSLYTFLHARNTINLTRPAGSPVAPPAAQRTPSSQRPMGPPMGMGMGGPMGPMGPGNGNVRGSRAPSMTGPPPPRHAGPPMNGPMNGYARSPNGMPRGPPPQQQQQMNRRPSFEDNNLEEFSHLMLYDEAPEGGPVPQNGSYPDLAGMGGHQLTAREQDYMMRQNSAQFRPPPSRGRGMGGGRRMPQRRPQYHDDDDDEDDYVDPMEFRAPMVDPDAIDMMSVTSRKARKAPSAQQLRKDPEGQQYGGGGFQGRPNSSFGRRFQRNRASAQIIQTIPGLHDSLMNDPIMGYSSNRYGNVDRKNIHDESRANSLTASRMHEMAGGMGGGMGPGMGPGMGGAMGGGMAAGPYPMPPSRRTSHSPGTFPNGRPPMPTQDSYSSGMYPDGQQHGGRPSPPGMMRAPVPRYPPGQGNAVAPQQVEQHAGVSNYPKASSNVPSLTGSASASAGSGESGHNVESSDPSAQSSTASLGPRPAYGVRA